VPTDRSSSRVFVSISLVSLIGFLTLVPAARAGTKVLGTSGWQASWDSSLDSFVDVVVDSKTANAVFIAKSAEFIEGSVGGSFPPIDMDFEQIAFPAVSQIVIEIAVIVNSTGEDWTDFHMEILNGGGAAFSLGGPSGFFTTSPLDNQMFGPGNTSFWADGFGLGPGGSDAVVADGDIWFPGSGASNGELFIHVQPTTTTPFASFTLRERPTPEPTALAMLGLGAAFMLRGRRKTV